MMNENILKLGDLIKKSKKIALFSHIRMDPDTFGSSGALYYILKKIGKKVVLINDEKAPKEFEFLGANEIISPKYNLEEFNPDLVISLDVASEQQLAESYKNNEKIIKKKDFVVIDHHITNKGFGDINIIDTKSSSTCEILYNILKNLDYIKYVDKKIANLLISGILTDTNVFYNTNVSYKTHKVASELLKLGADSRKSIFEFFKKKSINKTMLLSKALSNIQIIEGKLKSGKNIAYTIINKEDFDETRTNDRDSNGIIEHLINIENTEISFIIYPIGDRNKVSFRSREYNVGNISNALGGGGHKNASGFYSEKKPEKIVEEIIKNL